MRVPVTLTIFAVTAIAGTAVVVGPRVFANSGQQGDKLTANSPSRVEDPQPSGKPSPGSARPAGAVAYRSVATGCLDSNADGSVYVLACNGGNYQLWKTSTETGGSVSLTDVATGRCLDSNRTAADKGTAYTLPCNGGEFQHWTVESAAGNVRLHNKATGLCLFGADPPLTTRNCTDTSTPMWWKQVPPA
ncbi:MAG: hypothetical protein QOJ50_3014 [Cryptosporangiaceae bacterium]|nr:hypothetical protein [Cryptosporangiaceae bacterium]